MHYLGIGASINYDIAFKWINLAAKQGYIFAEHNLAQMYETGRGVEENLIKAYEYYISSARKGYLESQIKVADMYKNGIGTKKDLAKSAYWVKKVEESKP
jgi:TPR repeat protein